MALPLMAGVSTEAMAQGAAPPSRAVILNELRGAADEGPQALLRSLDQVLARDPRIASDPDTAAGLAADVADFVRGFRGANLPVYRQIVVRVVNAAPPARRAEVARAVVNAVGRAAASDPGAAPSPRPAEIGPLPTDREPAPATADARRQPLGFEVGSFLINPELQIAEYFDDNIFATRTSRVSDFVTVVSPHILANSNWDRHALNAEAHLDVSRYASNDAENATDYRLSTEGRLDLLDTTNLTGGALLLKGHEDRFSPDEAGGTEPTRYWDRRLYAGLSHDFSEKLNGRLGATFQRLTFADTPTGTGSIPNNDRNRERVTAGVHSGYRITQNLEPYVEALADIRRYDQEVDDAGFARNSNGYKAGAGIAYAVPGLVNVDVFAGKLFQGYADPALRDVGTFTLSGNLRWRVTPTTRLFAWVDRSIEESTLFMASSYIFSGTGATLEHDISSDLLFVLRASYWRSDFQGNGRRDHEYDVGAGLRYLITQNYYVAGDYRFQGRYSTFNPALYNRNQVFLRFGARF